MPAAFFDGTIEEAAADIRRQAYLASRLGPSAEASVIKLAAERPESVAQALTWLADPPMVDGRVDPAWGTLSKALMGAGIGAGAGGLVSLTDKERRKRWLRNTLLGGLLGGGLGAGAGLIQHNWESITDGPPGQAPYKEREKVVGQMDKLMANEEPIPPELKSRLKSLDQQIAKLEAGEVAGEGAGEGAGAGGAGEGKGEAAGGGEGGAGGAGEGNSKEEPTPELAPLSDKWDYFKMKWQQPGLKSKVEGAGPLLWPRPEEGIVGAGVGAATGAVADQGLKRLHAAKGLKAKSLEQLPTGQQIQKLPNRDFRKTFGKNWKKQKSRILSLAPKDGKHHGSFNAAYENTGRTPRRMDQAKWRKLQSRAMRRTRQPLPRMTGAKSLMGGLGAAGYLIPQFAPHAEAYVSDFFE